MIGTITCRSVRSPRFSVAPVGYQRYTTGAGDWFPNSAEFQPASTAAANDAINGNSQSGVTALEGAGVAPHPGRS